MITRNILKPFIICPSTNWLEANWSRVEIEEITIPEIAPIPAILDEDGNILVPEIQGTPASTQEVIISETPIKCVSYHPTQLDLLKKDAKALGTSLTDRTKELNAWVKSYVPEVIVKTPEEILSEAKAARQNLVDNIVVITQSGKSFDGDEASQGRITRAIVALQAMNQGSTQWVLSDNTIAEVSVMELVEALALAGQEQTRIWMTPYQ